MNENCSRRAYTRPSLVDYGSIARLTQGGGSGDGGGGVGLPFIDLEVGGMPLIDLMIDL